MHPNDGRVVSNFIIQALKGEALTIYGDGLQTRSFCYVDDMIEALVRLMNSDDRLTGPINIGNPTELTISALAKKIIKISGSKSKITFKKLPLDDPKQRKPDITLAKKELDWVPKIEIEEGLIKTIEYFEYLLKNDPRI
jgi:UDP-glucuronate decarboxylase